MKKTILFSALLVSGLSFSAFHVLTGPCDSMLFFKEGTATTMTHYEANGKVSGSTKTVYKDVTKSANEASVKASQQNYDKKGKLTTSSNFTIKCQDGTLLFDMKMFLPQQQAEAYKDMEMTIEGADMEMPNNLEVGKSLKDADIKFHFKPKGDMPLPAMKMEVKITNRKVEAKETITTPAGSFECFKISEDAEFKTLFSMKTRTINWFSLEAGNVRTESYKENGKLLSKSELTELKK